MQSCYLKIMKPLYSCLYKMLKEYTSKGTYTEITLQVVGLCCATVWNFLYWKIWVEQRKEGWGFLLNSFSGFFFLHSGEYVKWQWGKDVLQNSSSISIHGPSFLFSVWILISLEKVVFFFSALKTIKIKFKLCQVKIKIQHPKDRAVHCGTS